MPSHQKTRTMAGALALFAFALITLFARSETEQARADGPCIVTSDDDSGAGTLRDMMLDSGCAEIEFDLDAMETTTILLATTLPQVTRELVIRGEGQLPVVDGQDAVRVFHLAGGDGVTFESFTVANGGNFGGVLAQTSLTADRMTFFSNATSASGAGISATGGTLVVRDSTFTQNSAFSSGGAIYVGGALSATITGSTFSGNHSDGLGGGAIFAGGGVTTTIANSTFHNNTSSATGGAIRAANLSTVPITNSTFSGNEATLNVGHVIDISHGAAVLFKNSIIESPASPACSLSAPGTINSSDENVASDSTCGFNVIADSLLGPLQDNGGPTHTMALGEGSPALDAGDDSICAVAPVSNVDQRGTTRPIGDHCDLGAFEGLEPPTTCTVTSDDDSGAGTLREKMADITCDIIEFDLDAMDTSTIPLESRLPMVGRALTIRGANHLPIVDGQDSVQALYVDTTGELTLESFTISNGYTGGNGGGILVFNSGTLVLDRMVMSGNEAAGFGGAVAAGAGASVTVRESTFEDNHADSIGGAFSLIGANTEITGSTFSGNSSLLFGGAIYAWSEVTVANSTFTGNSAPSGGAIHSVNPGASLALLNSTISGNTATSGTGHGLYVSHGAVATVSNSIVASSATPACSVANPGVLNVAGHNLSSDESCGFDIENEDPLLGPLQDNGGPTHTMALGTDSPAIDAGDDAICADTPVLNLDQRGETRVEGAHCDLGAYEAAASCTVTSDDDSGPGTLREKMGFASCDIIEFDFDAMDTTTILLATSLTADTRSTTIIGEGGLPVVDGQDTVGVFVVPGGATLELADFTVANGRDEVFNGGGGLSSAGTTVLDTMVFSGNVTIGFGGAIRSTGSLTVRDSTFTGNSSPASIAGAIWVILASASISGSTFTGNSAAGDGGALYVSGSAHVTIVNSTFTGNTGASGGAIRAANPDSTMDLFNVTIAGNTANSGVGSGIHISHSNVATVANSIITSATGTACAVDGPGTLTPSGHNLDSDGSCGFDIENEDPLLGDLQDNGGPTETMALGTDSPAIDAGDDTICAAIPVSNFDQRGVTRPIGDRCDLGAFEAAEITDVPVTITVPAGVQFTLNSVTYTGTQTVDLAPGSYTLAATSPQVFNGGASRFVFNGWSDNGAISHSITVGTDPVSITGTFTRQHRLDITRTPTWGGTVTPASGTFYDENTVVPVVATPYPAFNFGSWTGAVAVPASASTTITMTAPQSITANFIGIPDLSIQKWVDNSNPAVGDIVKFTIALTSNGGATATDVVIKDLLPAGFEYYDHALGGAYDPVTGLWQVGSRSPGSTAYFYLRAKVLPTGPYTNTVEVWSMNELVDYDSTPGNSAPDEDDIAQVTLSPIFQSALTITKTNNVTSVDAGSTVSYTIKLTNNGPSPADGTKLHDPAVASMTKISVGPCTSSGGAICPFQSSGAVNLNIAALEAGTTTVFSLPLGGSIEFVVTAQITASSGRAVNTVTATPPAGNLGAAVSATDNDAIVDLTPPVVTATGPTQGATYYLGQVPPLVCTTTDPLPGSGVFLHAQPSYTGANPNGAGNITASCVGGRDIAGNVAPPVSINYTVVCTPTVQYRGNVRVKVGVSAIYQPLVTVTLSLNTTTCAVTAVSMASSSNAPGALQLNTVTNWKPPVQPAAGQWTFAMKTVNAATGGIFLNNAYRAMDGSSSLLVKFINNRAGLYFKLTGMAPTGVGITKAGFEAEAANLLPVTPP